MSNILHQIIKMIKIDSTQLNIANRLKTIRKLKKVSQKKLSILSNVSLGSIKRWEEIGEISLSSLIKIARALNIEKDFDKLFNEHENYTSIEEVIRSHEK